MNTMWKWAAGLALAVGLAGCAGLAGGSGQPCASCKYTATTVADRDAKPYCVIDGKKVDCKKSPAECPACREHSK